MLFSNLPLLIEKRTTKAKKNRKDVVLLNNFTMSVLFCSSFLKKNRALILSKFYEKRTEPVLFVEIGPYKKRFFQRTAKKNRHCSQKSLFSDVIRNGVMTGGQLIGEKLARFLTKVSYTLNYFTFALHPAPSILDGFA